jgi:hypothetical protein
MGAVDISVCPFAEILELRWNAETRLESFWLVFIVPRQVSNLEKVITTLCDLCAQGLQIDIEQVPSGAQWCCEH